MREFQILGCVEATGKIARKFIVTKIEIGGLHYDEAVDALFTMDADDQEHWVREVTPEVIAYETRHDGYVSTRLFPARLAVVGDTIEQSPDFPADTTFRDAWILDGDRIVHDMDKARAIHRDRMRAARAPLLAALDVAYQRADEQSDAAAKPSVAARKQALRDVTTDPAIAEAASPEALKAVWPEILQD